MNKGIPGTKIRVEHLADGMNDKKAKKEKRIYKVVRILDDGKEEEVLLTQTE